MTRFRRSLYLLLVASTTALAACTGSMTGGVSGASVFADADLLERTFQIEDVSGRGIVDRSNVTLRFGQDGQFSGNTGCNTVFGSYKRSGADLEFGALGSTRKMCAPALMEQEQNVLDILSSVTRIERDKEGALIVRTADGRSLRGFGSP